MAEKKTGKNPFEGIVRYFKEVRSELKKVAWPTYRQIANNTVIVMISIILVGILIWILDFGFSRTLGVAVDKYKAQSTTQSVPQGSTQLPINAGSGNVNVGGQQQQAQQQQGQQQQTQQQAAQNQSQSNPAAGKSGNNGK